MNRHHLLLLLLILIGPIPDLFGQNSNTSSNELSNLENIQLGITQEIFRTHPNQYFVKLCHGVSPQETQNLLAELNSVELWRNDELGLRLWAVKNLPYICSDGKVTDINKHLARSKKKTTIDEVTLDMTFGLETTAQEQSLSFYDANALQGELGQNPVKIAILDSGVSDPALGNYFGNITYTGYDYVDDDFTPEDQNGHGTHIFGVIYDILSYYGTPENVSFDIRRTHDANGLGNISDLVFATIDAADAGANIINMSFSYYDILDQEELNPMQLAIEYAEKKGALVVASAGNKNNNNDVLEAVPIPASLPNDNIIAVGSNDSYNLPSNFSNYGENSVDVSVIGESVPGPSLLGQEQYFSGTSFSTAIVSALSAILGSRQEEFNGCEIKCRLINTSNEVQGLSGLNQAGGVVDFQKALEENPEICGEICANPNNSTTDDCGANCPPETAVVNLCVPGKTTVYDQLFVYDAEGDPISFTTNAVYGPFKGKVEIKSDGSFTYTSISGEPDLFVYQVCDGVEDDCSDGCNQGIVYINTTNCTPPSKLGGYLDEEIEDCFLATAQPPRLLTFQYTGEACSASNHSQAADKVDCEGDPELAPFVFITAKGEDTYLENFRVALNETFSIDASFLGEKQLDATIEVMIKDEEGEELQEIEFRSTGEPLGIQDQFGSLKLVGYLAENGRSCGDPEILPLNTCKYGDNPAIITLRYTGENCDASYSEQDDGEHGCFGTPPAGNLVYIIGSEKPSAGGEIWFEGLVNIDGLFTVNAFEKGASILGETIHITVFDLNGGNPVQFIKFSSSCEEPLRIGDQFGSARIEGIHFENGETFGQVDIRINACQATQGNPRILSFQYTGDHCEYISHSQDVKKVSCDGDLESEPIVYVTAQADKEGAKVYFQDLEVPLNGIFDVDATAIDRDYLDETLFILLKDQDGNLLQEITFATDCSEPLKVGDQYGGLLLRGYLSENGELLGNAPISQECNPAANCETTAKRTTIGLVYTGKETTRVFAFGRSRGIFYLGGYKDVGPGDFIAFSSLRRNRTYLGHLFLVWGRNRRALIPGSVNKDILGNTYGDFKVVHQVDANGNDCQINYSSCVEVNRNCMEEASKTMAIASLDAPIQLELDYTVEDLENNKPIKVFPNPASERIFVDLRDHSGQTAELLIFDALSRVVRQLRIKQLGDQAFEIELDDLEAGVYNLAIHLDTGDLIMKKFVVTQ